MKNIKLTLENIKNLYSKRNHIYIVQKEVLFKKHNYVNTDIASLVVYQIYANLLRGKNQRTGKMYAAAVKQQC